MRRRRKFVTVCFLIITFVTAALPVLLTCVLRDEERARAVLAWQMHASFNGTSGTLLQTKNNSCAPAALAMILRAHAITVHPDSLEPELGLSSDGASLARIKAVAELHHLHVAAWRLDPSHLRHIRVPAMLFLKRGHCVVLDSVDSGSRAFVRDPAIGKITMTVECLSQLWNGETLIFAK